MATAGKTAALALALLLAAGRPLWAADTIRICEDESYPPFAYADASNPGVLHGATIEFVAQMFQHLGLRYQINLMPWARCLAYVRDGRYQIALDAYNSPERERTFALSRPYYTETLEYYYSRRRFGAGLNVSVPADLNKYQGCGIRGYDYARFGLGRAHFNTESDDHDDLVRKIKDGVCDYFVESQEVMQGFALKGLRYLSDPDLGFAPVPGAPAPRLHFLLTRSATITSWLLPMINREIAVSPQKHTMRQLVARALASGSQ